jgi:hypothetical protein
MGYFSPQFTQLALGFAKAGSISPNMSRHARVALHLGYFVDFEPAECTLSASIKTIAFNLS